MPRYLKTLAAAVTFSVAAGTAQAVTLVDQNNPAVAGSFCIPDAGALCGQSFQQDHANIAGAGVYVDTLGALTTLDFAIYSSYGTTPSGFITSANIYVTHTGWWDVTWSPVAITPGTTYFLVLSATASNSMTVTFAPIGSYADGNALANGDNFTAYDLTFRTYYDDTAPSSVPLPAALPLFGGGLAVIGLAGWRRRKRRAAAP
jgi:hypothetical protein